MRSFIDYLNYTPPVKPHKPLPRRVNLQREQWNAFCAGFLTSTEGVNGETTDVEAYLQEAFEAYLKFRRRTRGEARG